MLRLKECYTVTRPICSHDTKRNLNYVAACFLLSNYELRPAQVTGNRKYLHGNNLTFHRSRLSWVRSHNETISEALPAPFAAITEIWFCLVAHVSSWTREVYVGFLVRCHPGYFESNWTIFRKSRILRDSQEEWCCHKKNTSCCLQGLTGSCWEHERWHFKLVRGKLKVIYLWVALLVCTCNFCSKSTS